MRKILEDLRRNSRVVNNGLSYDPTTLIDKPGLDLLLSEEDKAFSNLEAENARLRKAGDAMAKKLDFLDDAIAYELSRDHEIGQLVATWREACASNPVPKPPDAAKP